MTKTIIKSNTGGVGPLSVSNSAILNRDLPITSVTLETKDLKDVDALLNFTCQINLPEGANVNLVFIIKKFVDRGPEQILGGSFVYTAEAENNQSESFGFQFLDENVDPGKHTYSIQLAKNSLVSGKDGVTITNGTLSLIATAEEKKEKKDKK